MKYYYKRLFMEQRSPDSLRHALGHKSQQHCHILKALQYNLNHTRVLSRPTVLLGSHCSCAFRGVFMLGWVCKVSCQRAKNSSNDYNVLGGVIKIERDEDDVTLVKLEVEQVNSWSLVLHVLQKQDWHVVSWVRHYCVCVWMHVPLWLVLVS